MNIPFLLHKQQSVNEAWKWFGIKIVSETFYNNLASEEGPQAMRKCTKAMEGLL